jgi:protein-tyrosine phosphatase
VENRSYRKRIWVNGQRTDTLHQKKEYHENAPETGWIDCHQHIIFGLDDGSKDEEMSHSMLRHAAEQGVCGIVCTSHAMDGQPFPIDAYLQRLEMLQTWVKENLPQLHLAPGAEIMWNDSVPRLLSEKKLPSLNGYNYILLEYYPLTPWDIIVRSAKELGSTGFFPVIAHVERYKALRKKGRLKELKERYGVYAQMNTTTVLNSDKTGLFGDRWPKQMLDQKLIDIVASDAHNDSTRICKMKDAWLYLSKQYGDDVADLLCQITPRQIWEGRLF